MTKTPRLSPAQQATLEAVRAADSIDGVTRDEIADSLGVRWDYVTATLIALGRRGLVSRQIISGEAYFVPARDNDKEV